MTDGRHQEDLEEGKVEKWISEKLTKIGGKTAMEIRRVRKRVGWIKPENDRQDKLTEAIMNPTKERTALFLAVLTASIVNIAVAAGAIIIDVRTISVELTTIIYRSHGRSRTR